LRRKSVVYPREKNIDSNGQGKAIPQRGAVGVAIVLLGLLGVFTPAGAVDFTGSVETRYLFQAGDNAFDNDVYNYHSLELSFSKNLTFSWYGGVIASLDDRVNTLSSSGTETSDNALRTLQDASNPGQYLDYTIYSAYLKYDAGGYGATVGRSSPADFGLIFDGVMIWALPYEWLKLEALWGFPWHYAYVANPSDVFQDWGAGEMAAGGGADARFFDEMLQCSLKYLFLREVTNSDGLISSSPATYLSADSLTRVNVSFAPQSWPWLKAGAGASVLDVSPLSAHAWVTGDIEQIHLSYSGDLETQLIDVSSISDRLTEFSDILTASVPYVDASVTLTENIAGFLLPRGFLRDLELELTYEHRQPVSQSDQSMFNPQYDQFRVATLLGAEGGWSLQAFFSFLLTSGLQNDLYVVGGEIGKKWSPFDVRLGSSFNASLYETDYTQTILQDSFYDQEYYLRVKWQINRSLDVSLKAAYENVLLTSITSGVPLNTDVDYVAMAGLNDSGRNYFRCDLRTRFQY
jgi:hypothetical protein